MLTLPVLRSIIDHLHRPFIQRLIMLVVSALLAMSLISTTIPLTLPPSGHEVASSASGRIAQLAYLDVSRIQGLVPKADASGRAGVQATLHYDRERRLV